MDILEKIVAYKKEEVSRNREFTSIKQLEKSKWFHRNGIPFADTLDQTNQSGVIAEFKRKSPSKQNINLVADINIVGPAYVNAGAGALSILTDQHFFGGQDIFLSQARELLHYTPLLRKEFIIDEYQIIEAKSIGADIILLIAEILTKKEIQHFTTLARSLDLEVLLELHSKSQIDKYTQGISMIGVNNRDLATFEVDYDRSKSLFDMLPKEIPKIAESGLSDWQTVVMLHDYGFRGFLIGEQFMKNEDPGKSCQELIDLYMKSRGRKQIVK